SHSRHIASFGNWPSKSFFVKRLILGLRFIRLPTLRENRIRISYLLSRDTYLGQLIIFKAEQTQLGLRNREATKVQVLAEDTGLLTTLLYNTTISGFAQVKNRGRCPIPRILLNGSV